MSSADLKRLYQTAKSQYERRAVCLRAIDEGIIHRGGRISSIDEVFDSRFSQTMPTKKEGKRIANIAFVPFVPIQEPGVAAGEVGWYMNFEYDNQGIVQNYILTNLHKGMSSRPEPGQKLSIAELRSRYEDAKTIEEQRAVCLQAIDDGAIFTTGPISSIDEIFGTHFAARLPTRQKRRRAGVIQFLPAKAVDLNNKKKATSNWFLFVEYDYNGDIQDFYLTNIHK
jgi:hypothetical protein